MAIKGLAELLKKIRENKDLTEAQVEEELNKALPEDWVPKTKFNENLDALKLAKEASAASAKQLEELKSKAGLSDEYKKKIDDLTAAHAAKEATYQAELATTKRNHAIEKELSGAKVRNAKAAHALLDESKIAWAEDGTPAGGLKEQLEALKKSDAYLFETTVDPNAPPAPSFGAPPAGASGANSIADQFRAGLGVK